MTAEPTHTHGRRSSDHWTGARIAGALLGAIGVLGSVAVVHEAIHAKPISERLVFLGLGLGVFSAGLITPDPIFGTLKRMAGVIRSIWKDSAGSSTFKGP